MNEDARRAVIATIRALGFIGNAHYCPACLNHFHEDRGQHEADCSVLRVLAVNEDWWEDVQAEVGR